MINRRTLNALPILLYC